MGVGELSSGSDNVCAVEANGGLRCWGWNFLGQLGTGVDGIALPHSTQPVAVRGVVSSRRVAQVACGDTHCCALDTLGRVECWGDNLTGALGTGTEELLDPTPRTAALPGPATTLALGGAHSCALLDDGSIHCWGSNFFGQLGDGTTTNRFVAVAVAVSDRFVAVAAGGSHTCGVTEGGETLCWGDNTHGQLGRGSFSPRERPAQVATGVHFERLRAGLSHTCALTDTNELYCWGSNEDGQLGLGADGDRPVPVRVGLSALVTAFDAGTRHTCAVLDDTSLWCWGHNGSNQASTAEVASVRSPSHVALASTTQALALGTTHTCAAAASDSVFCWGDGSRGQLGNDLQHSATPVAVAFGRTE